jgi:lipopolysaccharide export system protein LptA
MMDALDRTPLDAKARHVGLLWLLVSVLGTLLLLSTDAQVPVTGKGKNFVAPITDAQGRKTVLRGKDFRPAGQGLVEITGMKAETFRGQEKDMTVEAAQCRFDPKANVATSPGPLSIRTADDRFSIEGETFRWQLGDSRINSKLVISNRVHSLVRKRLIGTGPIPSASAPGKGAASGTNAGASLPQAVTGSTNGVIDITADQFEYQSESAIYRGQVRVHEAEGDLTCELLTVLFHGETSALERIEAEGGVILQQGTTRTIADKAVYTVGQDQELVEFVGNALWQDGERQGSGERVTFDRRTRTLRAEQRAYLRLPRAVLGGGSLVATAPGASAATRTNAPSAFVEVFSDQMTIQLAPGTGPIQQIIAEKNVLIVDPDQEGKALADRATYQESTGILELTGSPLMETERRLINGKILRFDRATRVFTAGPDSYVKLPFQAVAQLGIFSPPADRARVTPAVGTTNQFIEVWASQFEYHTNLLRFIGDVRANFLQADQARGQLTCGSLTILYGAQLESLLAEQNVELEQFASSAEPPFVVRKVSCPVLRAKFTASGRLQMATAEHGVAGEQTETRPDRPAPVKTRLSSETVTAFFSPLTNRVDHVVADSNVVFAQDERMARGGKAVYTETTGLMELTGQPTATMPEGRITEAERLVWDKVRARFMGKGKFKSEWKRPTGGTNQPTGVTEAKAAAP